MIDDRDQQFPISQPYIEKLCDRRFGIGADGLILLQNQEGYDFKMVYFNSDGRESSMCGNGGRCIVAFAKLLNIISIEARFLAVDGEHDALIEGETIRLKMSDVKEVEKGEGYYYMNTGSPHYVSFVKDVSEVKIVNEARTIRYNERFKAVGTNVNYVSDKNAGIKVRTYERGVEDETLSCGTGVTACAIVAYLQNGEKTNWDIESEGGMLNVRFQPDGNGFKEVWLSGPAEMIFKGEI